MTFFQFMRHLPIARHATAILVGALLAVPVTGFGCGVYICSDCGANPLNYLLIGVVHAVLTVISGGRCNVDFGFSYSLWPYMPISILFIYLIFMLLNYIFIRPEEMPPNPTVQRTQRDKAAPRP